MAKLEGPLLSLSASGSIGSELTFSRRRTIKQVRYQKKQKDRVTPGRTTQRSLFAMGVNWWHQLTTDEQDEWDEIARYDC